MLLLLLLIIDLNVLVPAVIKQIFIAAAELVIPTEIPINESNSEKVIQPVIIDVKISKCLT